MPFEGYEELSKLSDWTFWVRGFAYVIGQGNTSFKISLLFLVCGYNKTCFTAFRFLEPEKISWICVVFLSPSRQWCLNSVCDIDSICVMDTTDPMSSKKLAKHYCHTQGKGSLCLARILVQCWLSQPALEFFCAAPHWLRVCLSYPPCHSQHLKHLRCHGPHTHFPDFSFPDSSSSDSAFSSLLSTAM